MAKTIEAERITMEDLEEEEKDLVKRLKKLRTLRGVNPIPSKDELEGERENEVIDVQYKRLDPITGNEQTVLDDLSSLGLREVLANPSDPAAQVAFLKNLKQRPDVAMKLKDTILSEEFLEKALVALGGAAFGFWARGRFEGAKRSILDHDLL